MTSEMELVVGVDGAVKCIYDEALDLREIGKLQITRASHVEPDAEGYWSQTWDLLMRRCWGRMAAGLRHCSWSGGGLCVAAKDKATPLL